MTVNLLSLNLSLVQLLMHMMRAPRAVVADEWWQQHLPALLPVREDVLLSGSSDVPLGVTVVMV